MKYICLIYSDETKWPKLPADETQKIMGEYRALMQELQGSGHYLDGDRLQPTTAATTVRIRDGKLSTTDGPFAETKEQLGGFFMIEARDLNEAVQIAARIPAARHGSVEVRPVALVTVPQS